MKSHDCTNYLHTFTVQRIPSSNFSHGPDKIWAQYEPSSSVASNLFFPSGHWFLLKLLDDEQWWRTGAEVSVWRGSTCTGSVFTGSVWVELVWIYCRFRSPEQIDTATESKSNTRRQTIPENFMVIVILSCEFYEIDGTDGHNVAHYVNRRDDISLPIFRIPCYIPPYLCWWSVTSFP